jgi:hypothetical protein
MVKPESVGPPWQAMVESRAVLTAVQGLGSRFHQVGSPRGAAQSTGWRLAAAIGATIDVAKARALAHDDRFRLGPRLLLDAADERGRQQAEELTAGALEETRLALDARAPQLPPDVEGEARRRLDQVAPLVAASAAT